jgi:arginine/lysine/histidine transporter system substrate-binding protein
MKKYVTLFAAVMALMMLAGCATTPAATTPAATAAATATPAASAEATTAAAEATATPAAGGVLDAIKAKGELVVATNAEYPPFEMMDGDKFVGIDMEIAQVIADKLGVKLKIDNMGFDAVLAAVPTGKCDLGMSSLSITEDRKKAMDFTDPYMETSIKMLVAKGSALKSLDDLKGKKIGVQLGTLADTTVASFVEGAEVSRMNKDSDAVMDLINGKVDAVMTDAAPAQVLADKNADKIMLIDTPLSSDKLAIATKLGNADLLAFVNGVLKDMKADGSFDKIVAKYITAAK